jgi:hypothetical protein
MKSENKAFIIGFGSSLLAGMILYFIFKDKEATL